MKRKIKKTNFFKKRLDRRARLWYNLTRQPIWGYSSAGRALEWHSRGQRFDPAYLHQQKKTVFRLSFFVGQIRDLRRNAVRTRAFSAAEAAFFGLSKKEQNAKCHPPKADIPRPKESDRRRTVCFVGQIRDLRRNAVRTRAFSAAEAAFFGLPKKGQNAKCHPPKADIPRPKGIRKATDCLLCWRGRWEKEKRDVAVDKVRALMYNKNTRVSGKRFEKMRGARL